MKKTRSLLAVLICLALLVSLCAVTASAAETVTSTLDFTTLTANDDPAASAEAVKALGAVDCNNLYISDMYNPMITGRAYQGEGYFVQKIEAGEGKVFAEAPVLTLNYRLAAAEKQGYIKVQGSVDGVTYYDFAELKEATGNSYTQECKATATVTLEGGQGYPTVWVKVIIQHWGAQDAGCVDKSSISAGVKDAESAPADPAPTEPAPANQVSSVADFESLSEFAGVTSPADGDPAATKAKLEEMGLIIPERLGWFENADEDANHAWVLQNCFNIFLTPKDGYQNCAYIQVLDAGEGKVLEADAVLTLKYWLAKLDDPSYIVVETSADGENWEEAWANEEGQGKEYDASACAEENITLEGTAGVSKLYVKIIVNRHGGQTAGGVVKSAITGLTKDAPQGGEETPPTEVEPDETNPKSGDTIGVVVAMLAVSGLAITVLKKKEN